MHLRRRNTVLVLLLASLAFRLLFVGHDMQHLITAGPLYDDSFYCFQVARNIAQGYGSTFDGVHPTNGYQPLYVAMLVPLYWVTGNHPTVPIYLALIMSAFFNVVTGFILYRLIRRFVSWEAAVFGLVLWGFGPAIVRQAVNGLETSLAMLVLAATLEYYVTSYRARPHPTSRQTATLGLLLGLAMLARIDALLFGVALAIDYIVHQRSTDAARRLALAAVTAAIAVLPWGVASQVFAGRVFPESGRATRFLSEAYAPHDVPSVAHLSFENGPPPQLLLHNVGRSFMLLGTAPAVHVFTRALERFLVGARVHRDLVLYSIAAFLVFVTVAALWVSWRRRALPRRALPRDFNFLFLYSILLVAAYSLVIFGQIFYSRYYYPIFFFSIVLGCFAFDVVLGLVGGTGSRRRRAVAVAVLAIYAVLLPYMSWSRLQNGNYRFLNVVDWIQENTTADSRIGVFNSGAIGYFSDRAVFNLDGKVNREAFSALQSGSIQDYVVSERLDYVIDHAWIINRFLLSTETSGLSLVEVADAGQLGVPGWRAYRVERRDDASTIAMPRAAR